MDDCCKNKKEKKLKEFSKKIQYLYVNGCHSWLLGIEELHNTLVEKGFNPNFEVICITTEKMAKKYKFCGSPAILIDKIDIDPMAKYVKKYSMASCRPYNYNGKNYEFVPKGMILDYLKSL